MQEVSPESFESDFEFMTGLGYTGVLYKKGRMRPATFWRQDRVPSDGTEFHCDRTLVNLEPVLTV